MNRKLTIVFVLVVMLALIASCANNNEKLKEDTFVRLDKIRDREKQS